MNTELSLFLKTFLDIILEISTLFLIINFLVSLIQQYLPEDKIQKILGAKKSSGYLWAIFLGSITPFCICSTIPVLKGLLKAKIGFGISLVFLFVSPLINPIVITLFWTLLGWKITLIYTGVAVIFAVGAGIFLEQLGFERYVIQQDIPLTSCKDSDCCSAPKNKNISNIKYALISSLQDFKKVIPYLIISSGIGALIYDYVPSEILVDYIGNNIFAIPLASVIGIPLHVGPLVLIPLVSVLLEKGVSVAAMISLIIGGAGASLPEVILLKSLFKTPMIIAFLTVILSMAITAGYLVKFFIV